MPEDYNILATLKRKDANQQIVVLIAVVVLLFVPGINIWSFYLLAASQSISCFYWYDFFRRHEYTQHRSAPQIRKVFFIVLAIYAVCLIIFPLIIFLSIIMIFIGPILGMSYLIITMKEIILYKSMGAVDVKE